MNDFKETGLRKSAVDYLIDELSLYKFSDVSLKHVYDIIATAKKMEKQNIIDAFNQCNFDRINETIKYSHGQSYYFENYEYIRITVKQCS